MTTEAPLDPTTFLGADAPVPRVDLLAEYRDLLLVEDGLVTWEELEDPSAPGFPGEDAIADALARQLGLPREPGDQFEVDPRVAVLVPDHLSEAGDFFPLRRDGRVLVVASARPHDAAVPVFLARLTGLEVRVVVSTPSVLARARKQAMDRHFRWSELLFAEVEPEAGDATPARRAAPGTSTEPVRNLCRLILRCVHGEGDAALEFTPERYAVLARRPGAQAQTVMRLPRREAYAAVLGVFAELLGPALRADFPVPGGDVLRATGTFGEHPGGETLTLEFGREG